MFHSITATTLAIVAMTALLTAIPMNQAKAGDFSISIGFGFPIGYHDHGYHHHSYDHGYVIGHYGRHYVPNHHYYPPKHYNKHKRHHYTHRGYGGHKGYYRHAPRGYYRDYGHHRDYRYYYRH